MNTINNGPERGKLLRELKHEFLNDINIEKLMPVLSLLKDTNIIVPVNRAEDVEGENFEPIEVPEGKTAFRMIPDMLERGEKRFMPLFSNLDQIPKDYGDGLRMDLPAVKCFEMGLNSGRIQGFVLDAYTEPMELDLKMAKVVLQMAADEKKL